MKAGQSSHEFGRIAGVTDDYAYSLGIPLVLTIELPDKGQEGHLLSPSKIIPVAEPMYEALKSQVNYIVI